jgi:hypothetical protein
LIPDIKILSVTVLYVYAIFNSKNMLNHIMKKSETDRFSRLVPPLYSNKILLSKAFILFIIINVNKIDENSPI